MAALETPPATLGWQAHNFDLVGIDGKRYTLSAARGTHGLLVMFICNHCPYVKAIIDRVVRDAKALQDAGIGVIAIMSNDSVAYPDDSFENMKKFAVIHRFTFPYVIDETQCIAKAYNAVCTPDFFGFNSELKLQYRGRLDASRRDPATADAKRELYEAMLQVAKTGKGPAEQIASIGCSIKWKDAA